MSDKLYRVTVRGLCTSDRKVHYVVAQDAGQAYAKVRAELDRNDYGFAAEREMDKVELLAEDAEYPACKCRLVG